jgi:tetratricopeptide (TPR) repeat protein
LNECLELAPRDYESLLLLGATLTELEEYDEALKKYYQALDIQHHFETLSMISYTYIRAGKLIEGKKILRQLEEKTANVNISPTYLGIIYSALGEIDKAFEHLENAYKNGNSNITALKIDPRWKPLRHDPRFNDLLIKIGLPTN